MNVAKTSIQKKSFQNVKTISKKLPQKQILKIFIKFYAN